MFTPASPSAEAIRNLTVLVFAITGLIFFVVEGILLYCVVKFRRGPVPSTGEPPQVYGSMPIEIAWTAAPALVVFLLVLVTIRTLWEVNAPVPPPKEGDKALYVTVVGRQWWWEYNYDHFDGRALRFTTANELHVPASTDGTPRKVYLTLKSADVCHSFWVPRLGGKTDLIPGQTNHMWFETKQTGLFLGQCAEYCGTQHANMLIRVIVDPPDVFEKWLANESLPAATDATDATVQTGRVAFLSQSCVSCHRIRGTNAHGTFGPDLTHLMSRQTLAAGVVPNTSEFLGQWVKDPQRIKVGCLMPAFGLAEHDNEGIVRYLLTLH